MFLNFPLSPKGIQNECSAFVKIASFKQTSLKPTTLLCRIDVFLEDSLGVVSSSLRPNQGKEGESPAGYK